MRTITFTEPTSVVPFRASMATSLMLELGLPNFPATKNGTDVPLVGTLIVSVSEKAPVAPLRNPTTPPFEADVAESLMLTVDALTPDGLDTRIRHGEGAHATNRDVALELLLICNSTCIA